MKKTRIKSVSLLPLMSFSSAVQAITLYNKDNLKFEVSGFAEFDAITDSTRSLTEVMGSSPVANSNTVAGSNGREQFSIRNSRFALGISDKHIEGLQTNAYLEFDLFGYEPAPGTSPAESENSYYQSPTLRLRQAYLQAKTDSGWSVLAGQTWSLFGWQPYNVLSIISITAVTGELFERTPQVTVMKTFGDIQDIAVQTALSASRPTQRDSQMPNFDGGVRFVLGSLKSLFSRAAGTTQEVPLSIGVSGTYRAIVVPDAVDAVKQSTYYGTAFAVDAVVPLVTLKNDNMHGNTLVALGEYTQGSGYGDLFPGWTGGLIQYTGFVPSTGSGSFLTPNLDAGIGGFDSSKSFSLVRLKTWNFALQYHLPEALQTFVGAGFSELMSDNVNDLGTTPFLAQGGGLVVTSQNTIYANAQNVYVNVMHDFTKDIRVGAEFDNYITRFADNTYGRNRRLQFSTWYRF